MTGPSTTPAKGPAQWLLLHGTPLRPSIWTEVAHLLPGVTWIPDITPSPGTAQPQQQIARRLAEQASRSGGRWRVVGHSFGGQVALELAVNAPDGVEELIVVCTRDTPFPAFAAAAARLDAGDPVDTAAALHRWFRPAEIAAHPSLIDDVTHQLLQADRRSWATALRGIADFDLSQRIGGITAPSVVICTEYDPVGTPDAMRAMAERLPDADFSVIAEASHLSPFLDPARLAAAIAVRHL